MTDWLFKLTDMIPARMRSHDDEQPHFVVAVRHIESCWITLVITNDFLVLSEGLEMVKALLKGKGLFLMVERLVMDEHDDCRYNTTPLVETTI